jgi:ABC-type uncharacterized transport system permease subunit
VTLLGRDVRLEPRARPPAWARVGLPVGSVLAAGLLGGVFLAASGHDALEAYRTMLDSAFGGRFAIGETLVESAPLILTGASVAVAFSLLLFNVGAEGQLYLGAIASAAVALQLGEHLPTPVIVPLAVVAGAAGGALFALLAAVPRAYLGTSEIVVTLMLNFVALNLLNYLIFGGPSIFRDPVVLLFPKGRPIPDPARIPILSERVNAGILIAVALVVAVWFLLRSTRWGFEVWLVGDSPGAARYAGVNLRRKIVEAFLLSGALAGVAGAIIVTGRLGSLEPRAIVSNYGYLGILVAALARLNPLAVVPVGILIAAMRTAGPSMQRVGVPDDIVLMLQGMVLVLVVAGEFLLRYRVRLARRPAAAVAAVQEAP